MATVSALGTPMEFLLHMVVTLASFSRVEHRRLSVYVQSSGLGLQSLQFVKV